MEIIIALVAHLRHFTRYVVQKVVHSMSNRVKQLRYSTGTSLSGNTDVRASQDAGLHNKIEEQIILLQFFVNLTQ